MDIISEINFIRNLYENLSQNYQMGGNLYVYFSGML